MPKKRAEGTAPRKRKSKSEETVSEVMLSSPPIIQEPAEAPRRRGRPKKSLADLPLSALVVPEVGTLEPIPRKFVQFAQLVDVSLTPAQEVFAMVAYDGEDPATFTDEQKELCLKIFGTLEKPDDDLRRVVVAVCGARAGKSYIFVGVRLVHLALTVDVDSLAPGERGICLITAPDLRLALQVLRYCQGVASHPKIAGYVVPGERGGTGVPNGFLLQREGGKEVAIECLPATKGGASVRGRSLLGGAMDEAAFFKDENSAVNDKDMFTAIVSRIMKGGQLIVPSTAWADSGLLYEEFKANFGNPKSALAAHAPTTLMRPDEETALWVGKERRRDPDNAEREYDAIFMVGGGSDFFSTHTIDWSVEVGRIKLKPSKSSTIAVGGDFAFRKDSSAMVICERLGDRFYFDDPLELRPRRDKPLKPSEVCEEFAKRCREVRAESIVVDSHYIEAVREHMGAHGIGVIAGPEGAEAKVRMYIAFRDALAEGRIRLPDNERLHAQLKSIQRRPQPGGNIAISAPRTSGGHGDLVSAMVQAFWRLAGGATGYKSRHVPSRHDVRPARLPGTYSALPDYSSDI